MTLLVDLIGSIYRIYKYRSPPSSSPSLLSYLNYSITRILRKTAPAIQSTMSKGMNITATLVGYYIITI